MAPVTTMTSNRLKKNIENFHPVSIVNKAFAIFFQAVGKWLRKTLNRIL